MSCDACEFNAIGCGKEVNCSGDMWVSESFLKVGTAGVFMWTKALGDDDGEVTVARVTHCPWCGRELKGDGDGRQG